ncbi:heavy-metal-associated domain-containing protein [Bacillus benzoevorans]|uniref:Copper chaperone CopZ n=1 Tax=Bacillus benzoevorans TaxID=1456 RepID=A0A7X0HRY6_9BACI|nr:hypothetical protein [Bacillus benzoevorans]MBB6444471.1 copper chaperone CopZ [Bacillus benzoevorans]
MITRTMAIANLNKTNEEQIIQALHDVWGVRNIKLNHEKGEAMVTFDENAASFIDFEQAVKDCGFEASVIEDGQT